MKRNTIACMILVGCAPLFAWSNVATLELTHGKTGFFAGDRIAIPVSINAEAYDSLRLSWSLHISGFVTARHEHTIQLQQGRATHILEWDLPETRDGITIEGLLRLRLTDLHGNPLDDAKTPLYIFDPNPFAHREKWLTQLQLHVYDPKETTISMLENMDIPFDEIRNPEAFDAAEHGILIIGEGISLRESRGLMDAVFKAAQAGVSVIVLAPADGNISIPGIGQESHANRPAHLSFHSREIIQKLDKRLDSGNWREEESSATSYFQIGAHHSQPEMVVTKRHGWPWVALDWQNDAKMRFCGFAIVRDWDASPAPRYLLLAILASMQSQK